jgi:hypothetical protein
MLFSICWSLGASCDKAGRALVDKLIRSRVSELRQSQQVLPADAVMPDSATVYDWCYDHRVRRLERHARKSATESAYAIVSSCGLTGDKTVYFTSYA